MDFRLTDEQTMLKDTVDRFVAEAYDFEQGRLKTALPDGFAREDWTRFADLGWLMLMIPEDRGGLGWDAVDAAVLMEGFGRGLVSAPYLSSAVLAVDLLTRCEATDQADALLAAIAGGEAIVALASEESRSRYDPLAVATTARASGDSFVLEGAKIAVPDGSAADHFLVPARLDDAVALFLVTGDASGLSRRSYRTIDGRRSCDLTLEAAPAILLMTDAAAALVRAIDLGSVLLGAEALGCMESAMAMSADYLRTREQFGRTLSKFQVLTHRMADMFVQSENARSMLLRGLSGLDAAPDERGAAASATMVTILSAAEFVCGQAIQLHGGIGMAEEHPVGHFYKRIRAIGRTYGDVDRHRRRHLSLTQGRSA